MSNRSRRLTFVMFLLGCVVGLALTACRGSLLNPLEEKCEVTGIDSIPDPWGTGDSTKFAVITTRWCEWKLVADSSLAVTP